MLRRSKKFLLVGLLAVWAQIFAPMLPYIAAAADPLAAAEICAGMTASDGADHRSGDSHGSPACAFHCALANAGLALLAGPEATASVVVRSMVRTVWAERGFSDGVDARRTPAQARAPPLLS